MNIYYQRLLTIANNDVMHQYLQLCETAQCRANNRKDAKELLGYVEGHHIMPRAFKRGGKKDPINYAYFTAREHFIAHTLIADAVIGTRFEIPSAKALAGFTHGDGDAHRALTPEEYEIARLAAVKAMTGPNNHMYGKPGPMKGKKHTEETKKKVSKTKKGVKNPKLSAARKGKPIKHFADLIRKSPMTKGKTLEEVLGKERATEIKKKQSEKHKGKKSLHKGLSYEEEYGIDKALSVKKKLSDANKGKVIPREQVDRMKAKTAITNKTPETKLRRSIAASKPQGPRTLKFTCEYCNLKLEGSNYKRWHGPNCKLNPNYINKQKLISCINCRQTCHAANYKRWHGINCRIELNNVV